MNKSPSPLSLCLVALISSPLWVGCDDSTNKGLPPGAPCTGQTRCEEGRCFLNPDDGPDAIERCHLSCFVVGDPCPSGGSCQAVPNNTIALFCPNQFCEDEQGCGVNADCVGVDDSLVCLCATNFFGDARSACDLCADDNSRAGCVLQQEALAAVPGNCLDEEGGVLFDSSMTDARPIECQQQSDCGNPTAGCFGFQPAVAADPRCACADLRGLDVSQGDTLGDLTGAWYDSGTLFPPGPLVLAGLGGFFESGATTFTDPNADFLATDDSGLPLIQIGQLLQLALDANTQQTLTIVDILSPNDLQVSPALGTPDVLPVTATIFARFDPTTSGAFGPGALLAGTDFSGESPDDLRDFAGIQLQTATLTDADLSFTNLSGADLTGADLTGANLTGADLTGADLSSTNLTGADLTSADLSQSNLTGANLTGANLTGANLSDANLSNANLSGADLSGADLSRARLAGADLSGVSLDGVVGLEADGTLAPWLEAGICETDCPDGCTPGNHCPQLIVDAIAQGQIDPLSGDLEGASLPGVDLSGVNLAGARLKSANLLEAILTGADLTGADLTGANLTDAMLDNTRLAAAKLDNARLTGANLAGALSTDTVCPTTRVPCYDQDTDCQCSGSMGCVCEADASAFLTMTGASLSQNPEVPGSAAAALTSAILPGVILSGADLSKVDLSGADLTGATLTTDDQGSPVNLTGADLSGAILSGADLTGALMSDIDTNSATQLGQATLSGADLTGANLASVNLSGSNLSSALLDNVNASRASMSGADLTGAQASSVNLTGADLSAAKLDSAVMSGANLTEANLTGATAIGVDLSDADLRGATLDAVDFTGAIMKGTLMGCDLADTQCEAASTRGTVFGATNLTTSNIGPADLRAMDLRGLDFTAGLLSGALMNFTDLRGSIMASTSIADTNMSTTLLSGADLTGADLSGSVFSGNNIRNAIMVDADLSGTDLRGTRLDGANMTGAMLATDLTDSNTSLRSVTFTGATLRGCIRADLSRADLSETSLLRAGLTPPAEASDSSAFYAPELDFNCRINFEGALLPPPGSDPCGDGAFPNNNGWLDLGRGGDNVFLQENLLEELTDGGSGADLRCAKLDGASLAGFDLRSARLNGAGLDNASLGVDRFQEATQLNQADLEGASLVGTSLGRADLRCASIKGADILGADLREADLRGADLRDTAFDDSTQFALAKFNGAGITIRAGGSCNEATSDTTFPAQLRWRQLGMIGPQSDLQGAQLGDFPGLSDPPVDLSGANLKGASLHFTDLSGVDFTGANLQEVNLANTILRGANFTGANALSATFSGASLNASTSFNNANLIKANFVGPGNTPNVTGALCSEESSFNGASVAYLLLLDISIEGSFPLFFPVITLEVVPGWKVNGVCCFPIKGGVRLGC